MNIPAFLKQWNTSRALVIIFTVGLIGHAVMPLRPLMFFLTPWVLVLTGLMALYPSLKNRHISFIVWFVLGAAATFTVEVIGVKTGLVFGPYHYDSNLGIKIFGVPPVIGFNWMMVLSGFIILSEKIDSRKYISIPLTVLCATAFDYIMEPVAIHFRYWEWHTGSIPLQNYAAWAVIALVLTSIYHACGIKSENRLPGLFAAILTVYFSLLSLVISHTG